MAQLVSAWPFWGLIVFLLAYAAADRFRPRLVNAFEEGVVGTLLVAITVVTFSQVVARYGFSSGWTGALELTRILFAWLILFGASYGLRINAHLGVDAFVHAMPRPLHRGFAIFGALICLLYGVTLLSADWLRDLGVETRGGGAIDYWSKMFKVGIGLDEISYPQWLADAFGFRSSRVHRWIAYLVLPLGLGLFAFRSLQAVIAIVAGKRDMIVASHEAEDLVAENRNVLKD